MKKEPDTIKTQRYVHSLTQLYLHMMSLVRNPSNRMHNEPFRLPYVAGSAFSLD